MYSENGGKRKNGIQTNVGAITTLFSGSLDCERLSKFEALSLLVPGRSMTKQMLEGHLSVSLDGEADTEPAGFRDNPRTAVVPTVFAP